ncbi:MULTISPECIES: DMT family transporter [Clostridium]|uniref:DMT family transporter n=1 Tax=Clostridium TaxID=1485 RepID=UPI00082462A4|nr:MULTISPECIES: DMT family transporter [Clostridium]PJI09196.1 EamA/RhaT family transporter [Clostridium sp. CT7]
MKKGYLYILLSTILFSSMEIALKLVASIFNPIQLTFLRFLIGALILMPFALKIMKKKNLKLNKSDYKFFLIEGFICVVISMTFFQLGVLNCKASIVAILFSCNPIFVIPFAYFMLDEKVYKATIVSLIISIIGMIVIMNPANMTSSVSGIIFTLISAVTFALYGVVGKKRSARYGGIVSSSFCFLFGSLEMLVLILISKISFVANALTGAGLKTFANISVFQGIRLATLPNLIYIGIFITGLGYTFYFLAMEETSAATASLVFYIKPALAPILALIILHESIALNTIAGIVLIIASSCITFIANSRRAKANEENEEEEAV